MAQVSWSAQEELFRLARAGDCAAWNALAGVTVVRLERLLAQRFGRSLAPWEIEDAAQGAFEEAALRFGQLASWGQAWVYARKTAQSLALKAKKRSRPTVSLSDSISSPMDPRSLEFVQKAEIEEELDAMRRRLLGRASPRLLQLLLSSFEGGRARFGELAELFSLSKRTLKRRVRWIKDELRRRLGN